jgi:hypothetical protein
MVGIEPSFLRFAARRVAHAQIRPTRKTEERHDPEWGGASVHRGPRGKTCPTVMNLGLTVFSVSDSV